MNALIASDGTRHLFRHPVLAVGSGAAADVQLAGLASVHCVLAPTPAGPILRSFAPKSTLVNGEATDRKLLRNGDALQFGTHTFTVDWLDAAEIIDLELPPLDEERTRLASARISHRQEVAAFDDARRKYDAERMAAEETLRLADVQRKAMEECAPRLAGLQAEVEGLEQRAEHARKALAALDAARNLVPVDLPAAGPAEEVALDTRPDPRSVDQLLTQLRRQEEDVIRERQRLAATLRHAAEERERLNDRQLLLNDRMRRLDESRHPWRVAAAELEELANALALRETALNEKAASIAASNAELARHVEKVLSAA